MLNKYRVNLHVGPFQILYFVLAPNEHVALMCASHAHGLAGFAKPDQCVVTLLPKMDKTMDDTTDPLGKPSDYSFGDVVEDVASVLYEKAGHC